MFASSVKREGVGWASIFRETNELVTFCGFIIRSRINNHYVNPEYITYYMRSPEIRNILINNSSQVTITNINQQC